MALESYIRKRLSKKGILIMTHIVLGYPSFNECFRVIETMAEAGVDMVELQIPFSEPVADGPVILRANQQALKKGVTVQECLAFARKTAVIFGIPFLIMTYYNIPFKYGLERFAQSMADGKLQGAIIPDLPPEEGREYVKTMGEHGLAPVFIFSPTTPFHRMQSIASMADGFIYCAARKGVTGQKTRVDGGLSDYLATCRRATSLPLALGFGISGKEDIRFLMDKADIAVIGTQALRVLEQEGIGGLKDFLRGLS